MNVNKDAQGELSSEFNNIIKIQYEHSVNHLKYAYENSQAVVRFLDTKAAAVLGVVPIILGVVAAIVKWAHEFDADTHQSGFNGYPLSAVLLFVVLATLLILSAAMALVAALKVIHPKDVGDSKTSLLFPSESFDYTERLRRFTESPTEAVVFEDYERQLGRMSEIVKKKMSNSTKAIFHTRILLLVSVVCILATVFYGGYRSLPPIGCGNIEDSQTSSQTDPISVPAIEFKNDSSNLSE